MALPHMCTKPEDISDQYLICTHLVALITIFIDGYMSVCNRT